MIVASVVVRRATLVAFAPIVLAACRYRHADSNAVSTTPRLDVVRPDSVSMPRGTIIEVVLVGKGFAPGTPGANTIEFAGMSIGNVPATATGDTIRFVIPESVTRGGEAPPIALETGTYPLRVTTAAGTSNALTIRVYR
jgi:hypothetical protein